MTNEGVFDESSEGKQDEMSNGDSFSESDEESEENSEEKSPRETDGKPGDGIKIHEGAAWPREIAQEMNCSTLIHAVFENRGFCLHCLPS